MPKDSEVSRRLLRLQTLVSLLWAFLLLHNVKIENRFPRVRATSPIDLGPYILFLRIQHVADRCCSDDFTRYHRFKCHFVQADDGHHTSHNFLHCLWFDADHMDIPQTLVLPQLCYLEALRRMLWVTLQAHELYNLEHVIRFHERPHLPTCLLVLPNDNGTVQTHQMQGRIQKCPYIFQERWGSVCQ